MPCAMPCECLRTTLRGRRQQMLMLTKGKDIPVTCSQLVVEPPLHVAHAAQVQSTIAQLAEERLNEVDASISATTTLIANDSRSSRAVSRIVDGDALAAVRVAIALSTHELPGKSDPVLGVSIDVPATSTEATAPIGEVSNTTIVCIGASATGGGSIEAGGSRRGTSEVCKVKSGHGGNSDGEIHDEACYVIVSSMSWLILVDI